MPGDPPRRRLTVHVRRLHVRLGRDGHVLLIVRVGHRRRPGQHQAAAQSPDLHTVVDATIDDIQSWWADQLPDVYGEDYEPIPAERVFAYSEDNPPPACGGRGTTPYEQVAGNAFYCSEGDFVAWDEQELFPRLEQKFGGFAIALVLAHEWGHAIQARTSSSLNATVYLETQADCFAGSWAQHVEQDDPSLPIGDTDLDIALGGFLEFRDPPGVDPSVQGAHGNAFDRGQRVPGRHQRRRAAVRRVRVGPAGGDRDRLHQPRGLRQRR